MARTKWGDVDLFSVNTKPVIQHEDKPPLDYKPHSRSTLQTGDRLYLNHPFLCGKLRLSCPQGKVVKLYDRVYIESESGYVCAKDDNGIMSSGYDRCFETPIWLSTIATDLKMFHKENSNDFEDVPPNLFNSGTRISNLGRDTLLDYIDSFSQNKTKDAAINPPANVIKPTNISIPLYSPEKDDIPAKLDNQACIICMENEKQCVLIPCGHALLCVKCVHNLYENPDTNSECKKEMKCPTCSAIVERVIRIYSE